jgi:transposase
MAEKPIRNNLTVGASLMLAALGRACVITSKDGWAQWARTTSLEYLLRTNFSKVDSQHFWDSMDAFPVESIENAELKLLENTLHHYSIKMDSLFYDTTNFYTYINTTNSRCHVAKRGKNKQKRMDLRQIGLALVVTRDDMIPLFHHSYEGNMNDAKVFSSVMQKIKDRLVAIGANVQNHTIVFDRGNNSKKNIELVESLDMKYVGALTPFHHKSLVEEASTLLEETMVNSRTIMAYRTSKNIWGQDMTVVVTISDKLKEGQIRGIHTSLASCDAAISKLNRAVSSPKSKKRSREELERLVKSIISRYRVQTMIEFNVLEDDEKCYGINHTIKYDCLAKLEEEMGYRILMTNNHTWSTCEIIQAYHGQSFIENTFKNMKNQQHLSFNPQYHWTDQKIKVHNFCCVIAYLMTSLIYKTAREKGFAGSIDTLLDLLGNIRLGTIIEDTGKKGKPKAVYKLEEMEPIERKLAEDLQIMSLHESPMKLKGFGVYT